MKNDFLSYMKELKKSIDSLKEEELNTIADVIFEAVQKDKLIFVFGNGDSATNAIHFASDIPKHAMISSGKRLKIISLNQNVPLLTAWANDSSYDMVFKSQLENMLSPGDVVIGISTRGNSANVFKAIEYANEKGAVTIAITAFDGGKLLNTAKHSIVVDTNNMEIAEDVHFVIGHMIKNRILNLLLQE